jgi:hypothetical protein
LDGIILYVWIQGFLSTQSSVSVHLGHLQILNSNHDLSVLNVLMGALNVIHEQNIVPSKASSMIFKEMNPGGLNSVWPRSRSTCATLG